MPFLTPQRRRKRWKGQTGHIYHGKCPWLAHVGKCYLWVKLVTREVEGALAVCDNTEAELTTCTDNELVSTDCIILHRR